VRQDERVSFAGRQKNERPYLKRRMVGGCVN
jgi:hypothetical protein